MSQYLFAIGRETRSLLATVCANQFLLPVHLLPLREQPTSLRMLLLRDRNHLQLTVFDPLFGEFVPTWYVTPATSSPRSEYENDRLFAQILLVFGDLVVKFGQSILVSDGHRILSGL